MPTVQPLRISIYKHQQNLIFHRFWNPLHTKTSIQMQNNHPTDSHKKKKKTNHPIESIQKMDIHIPNFSFFENLEQWMYHTKLLPQDSM